MARYSDPESKEAVGERLELLRLAMDVQNQALAGMIGVSPAQWRNYKVGDNMIPVDSANRLCMVTGADLDFIYRGLRDGITGHLRERLLALETNPRTSKRA